MNWVEKFFYCTHHNITVTFPAVKKEIINYLNDPLHMIAREINPIGYYGLMFILFLICIPLVVWILVATIYVVLLDFIHDVLLIPPTMINLIPVFLFNKEEE
jgi:hypothetical protein